VLGVHLKWLEQPRDLSNSSPERFIPGPGVLRQRLHAALVAAYPVVSLDCSVYVP